MSVPVEAYSLTKIISEKEAKKISMGEGHLHENAISCTSYYTYPNEDNLKGIGLHRHQFCDDIELLLKGKVACFQSRTRAIEVSAPAMIVNRPGVIHSVVNLKKEPVLVFSFRSPKSYEGTVIRPEEMPEVSQQKQEFYSLKKFPLGTCKLAQTERNQVYTYRYSSGERIQLKTSPFPERTIFSMSDIPLGVYLKGSSYQLEKNAFLVISSGESVEIRAKGEGEIKFLEYVPTPLRKEAAC